MRSHLRRFTALQLAAVMALGYFMFGDLITPTAIGTQFAQEASHDNTGRISFMPQPYISIVIEEKSDSLPILIAGGRAGQRALLNAKALPESTETRTVTFSISGGAVFAESNGPVASVERTGTIMLPAITGTRTGDEGLLTVTIDGRIAGQEIRVATLPTGGLNTLRGYLSADDPAVIAMGDNYAVVDESLWQERPAGSVSFVVDAQTSRIDQLADGLCIRTPFGPGKVNYSGFGPWDVGKRYSYKPESSSALKRGSGSSDELDALYRYSWGCGTALKIPDSCTSTVSNNGSINSCCNAAAAALGHTPKWVNPTSHGFPRCPLAP